MVYKIDGSYMKKILQEWDRDYFSVSGCDALADFYDEINGENFEFDPVAVCCDCNEYGENAALSFDDMLNDYGYILEDAEDVEDDTDKISALVEELESRTTVLHVPNGNYIVFSF